jgi:hypothetical protein
MREQLSRPLGGGRIRQGGLYRRPTNTASAYRFVFSRPITDIVTAFRNRNEVPLARRQGHSTTRGVICQEKNRKFVRLLSVRPYLRGLGSSPKSCASGPEVPLGDACNPPDGALLRIVIPVKELYRFPESGPLLQAFSQKKSV